jgi:hypothetical protein
MLYKDVIYCIFLHLDVPMLLAVARVCRLFALMAKEDNLWRRFNEGGGGSQFFISLKELKSGSSGVEFSFTGVEKRIHKGKCRDLLAAMGTDVQCAPCRNVVRLTPAYWRANKVAHYTDPRLRQSMSFCCGSCLNQPKKCIACNVGTVVCNEEVLKTLLRSCGYPRCEACRSKWPK